ncbi:MAG: hypothetical protein AAGF01_23065 [Cyanobacteria bacterium P01_G01_bin.38]
MLSRETFDGYFQFLVGYCQWHVAAPVQSVIFEKVREIFDDDEVFAELAYRYEPTPGSKPFDFIAFLKQEKRHRRQMPEFRRLVEASGQREGQVPCEGVIKVAKLLGHIQRLMAEGKNWQSPEYERLQVVWQRIWVTPLTDEDRQVFGNVEPAQIVGSFVERGAASEQLEQPATNA